MEMAPYHATHDKRVRLLQDAHECLLQAQAAEERVLSAQQGHHASRKGRPTAPVVLWRTSTSVAVTCPPLRARGKSPTHFAVYGKLYAPGLALSINNTAAGES